MSACLSFGEEQNRQCYILQKSKLLTTHKWITKRNTIAHKLPHCRISMGMHNLQTIYKISQLPEITVFSAKKTHWHERIDLYNPPSVSVIFLVEIIPCHVSTLTFFGFLIRFSVSFEVIIIEIFDGNSDA